MTRITLLTLLAALALSAPAAGAKTYEIPEVADFTELTVADPVNVVYNNAPGGATAVISGPDATVSYVIVESAKGKMTIRLSDDGLNATDLPTVTVTSPRLVKAQNNTDSTLTVNLSGERLEKFTGRLEGNGRLDINGLNAGEVNVKKFTGRGVINASGECDVLSANNTGTGSINCGGLTAGESKCKVVGTGSICTHVTKTLSVTGVSGTVYYTGTPAEIKSRTLGVKLRPIEQQPAE
ncbi:MAG: DUF2807 domain-containing protein [Candidatus Amulumruptor caecigallinarius]|nr:DUF2807 domain-containing protein [Candidatus Amulumruptor caecigallinarius]MCM1397004.1 DUF2807 domain-containing protein [Candidatus Amulumruptor caecigallinarius]MCM1454638.1 DUF2807 domain-containing protein [bacterium]